jgi:hypothetical protein
VPAEVSESGRSPGGETYALVDLATAAEGYVGGLRRAVATIAAAAGT